MSASDPEQDPRRNRDARRAPGRAAALSLAALLLAGCAGPGRPSLRRTGILTSPARPGRSVPTPASTGPPPRPPTIAAPSAILADLDTGRVMFARALDQRRPIASVTKVMTAMLALHELGPSEPVPVSARAAGEPGNTLGLRPGERPLAGQLLYGLLLHSADDAAVALAERVAGTVPAFVGRMNDQARALEMTDTRFASPDGFDDRGYSTARDVAVMIRWAMRDPRFAAVVRTRTFTVTLPGPRRVALSNLNELLFHYWGAIGVKTGLTKRAGYCLAAAAARDGMRLLAVLLGDPHPAFGDAAALLDYGFGVAGGAAP